VVVIDEDLRHLAHTLDTRRQLVHAWPVRTCVCTYTLARFLIFACSLSLLAWIVALSLLAWIVARLHGIHTYIYASPSELGRQLCMRAEDNRVALILQASDPPMYTQQPHPSLRPRLSMRTRSHGAACVFTFSDRAEIWLPVSVGITSTTAHGCNYAE
jgi:hypothetical protein